MHNPFKAHIVKFDESTYAIRKFRFAYMTWMYKDLQMLNYWWPQSSVHFKNCLADKSTVDTIHNRYFKKGERV